MNIFAIIVTYNAMHRGWIDKCLASLKASTVPVTAIVVDNLSTDGTREHVPSRYPDIVWLPQDKNLGFGQANNLGIQYALEHHADYVLLLNQDATIAPDALQLLLAESDGKSLLTPVHLNGDGSRLDHMFRLMVHMSNNQIIDDILLEKGLADSYCIGHVSAACWLLPRAVIQTIGGFNPLFFHYGEDDNYLQRLEYHKIQSILVPKAKMYHDREEHGNMKAFNHKKLHRDILFVSCNINLSAKQRIAKYLYCLKKSYAKDFPSNQYRPFAWTKEMLWLISHSGTIKKSRSMEMEEGMTWLNHRLS